MKLLKQFLKYLLCILFLVAGSLHFLKPAIYMQIMPPYIPWPLFMVYFSGFCEVAFGLLLVLPKYSQWAAWGLIALLIAIFPANLHMALNPETFPQIPKVALLARLPLQLVFIAWAYWYTK
jgi:uncharacterized membrane protein